MITLAGIAAFAHGLPAKEDWRAGFQLPPMPEKLDRLFLVNRGWIEGTLVGIQNETVTFKEAAQEHKFTRSEISLVQFTGWLNPGNRRSTYGIDIRIEMSGDAETAILHFGQGAIISKVNKEPVFTKGRDRDDRAGTTATTIWFDKGAQDRNQAVLTTDITLVPGRPESIECEVELVRGTSQSGSLFIEFIAPGSGKPLVSLKTPMQQEWHTFTMTTDQLKGGRSTSRLHAVPWNQITASKTAAVPPLPAAPFGNNAKARVILCNGKTETGYLASIDADTVALTRKAAGGPDMPLPRGFIAAVELHDWCASLAIPADDDTTRYLGPLRVVMSGTSYCGGLRFDPGDEVFMMVSPPHFVLGNDRRDTAVLQNASAFGFNKGFHDRSEFQFEAIVVLKLRKQPVLEADVINCVGNSVTGQLRVELYEALTGRQLWASSPILEKQGAWRVSATQVKLSK